MKKLILVFLVFVSFYSCQEDDDDSVFYPKTLEYTDYKVYNMYVYSAPSGTCDSSFNQPFLERKWEDYLNRNNDRVLKIYKDSLFLIPKGFNIKTSYVSKVESNKIYVKMANDKWYFFGEWLDNETFVQVENFRYSHLYAGWGGYYRESFSHDVGTASFSDLFNQDRTIKNPEELKTIGDTVAWCNFGYIYHIIE